MMCLIVGTTANDAGSDEWRIVLDEKIRLHILTDLYCPPGKQHKQRRRRRYKDIIKVQIGSLLGASIRRSV